MPTASTSARATTATGRATTSPRARARDGATRARDAARRRDGPRAPTARRRGRATRRATRDGATRDATGRRTCVVHDLSRALTPYDEAWAWQRGFLARALERGDDASDAAILLQHPPTVTLGAGSTVDNLKFSVDRPPEGFEVRRCERGGEATYHGPGQLVLYPILNLARAPHEADLHWYMRALESVALEAMIELGLDAAEVRTRGRVDGGVVRRAQGGGGGRARAAMGVLPRRRPERLSRPLALRQHHPVRHRRQTGRQRLPALARGRRAGEFGVRSHAARRLARAPTPTTSR